MMKKVFTIVVLVIMTIVFNSCTDTADELIEINNEEFIIDKDEVQSPDDRRN